MNNIIQQLGIQMSDYEFKKILGIIANTEPHLDIVEDIEQYLYGMVDTLSDRTKQLLFKSKEQIANLLELIREED